MGINKNQVVNTIKFLASIFERAGVHNYVVTGGASLLLRDIVVETEDIDIFVAEEKLKDLWRELKEQNNAKNLHSTPFIFIFHYKDVEVNLLPPTLMNAENISDSEVIYIEDLEIKLRKLTYLRADLEMYIRALTDPDLCGPMNSFTSKDVALVRSKAKRLLSLHKRGVF